MGKKMPVPGIIGGAGPGATSQLYLDIIARCRQAGVHRRPAVLMASLDLDLAVEARLLTTGEGLDDFIPPVTQAARSLYQAGADFIVIPCNTIHLLLPVLKSIFDLPVLSIVDGVVAAVEAAGGRRVGLLGTGATVNTGLFQAGLDARGIEVICPDGQRLEALARLIRNEVDQERTEGEEKLGNDIID